MPLRMVAQVDNMERVMSQLISKVTLILFYYFVMEKLFLKKKLKKLLSLRDSFLSVLRVFTVLHSVPPSWWTVCCMV